MECVFWFAFAFGNDVDSFACRQQLCEVVLSVQGPKLWFGRCFGLLEGVVMTSSKAIHDLISTYLKTGGLDTFAASFAELFYDIEATGDAAAIQLAYSVESLLAAVTAGVSSEVSLYESLQALSPSLSFVVYLTDVSSQHIEFFTKLGAPAATETVKLVTFDIAPSVGFGSAAHHPVTHQTNTGPLLLQQSLAV